MLFTDTVFFGIDPTAGKRPFVYAAIDSELNLIIVDEGTIDDTLAFAATQSRAFVGVCSPRRPNQGLMADDNYRQSLSPVPNPGRWRDFRAIEYLLRQRNIRIPGTPGTEDACPNWMQMGFCLYQRLEELGYNQYPGGDNERQYSEVYPHASYSAMLGILPFPKSTLEGRLQRQLALYQTKMRITDPMRIFEEITRYRLLNGILPTDSIYSQGGLDALVAAYTMWYVASYPDETVAIGDQQEGQIFLPVADVKERYT